MLYCSSECGSFSIMQLRTIYCNTYVYSAFHVCLCLLALTFVCNSTYLLKCSFQIYQKSNVVFIRCSKVWFKTTSCAKGPVIRCKRVFANFTSTKSRIALQVARKIAPCNRALIHVCLAYIFLHSGQVLSSFKCYFKPKYLNLIDSNCDVARWVLPVVFYRDCSFHRRWMYYQYICDIGEEKSLWDGCSSICSPLVLRIRL